MINVLSLNENECNSLGRSLGFHSLLPSNNYNVDDIRNATKKLALTFEVAVEIHTIKGSAWSYKSETEFAKSIKVKAMNLTGAGDSWDAANMLAYLAGLDPRERLCFSNAYSSLYVKNPNREPATMNKILNYMRQEYKNM